MSEPNGAGESRIERASQRRMRRRMLIAVGVFVAVALVAGIAVVVTRQAASRAAKKAEAEQLVTGNPSRLTLFAVSADPAFTAVVGTGGGRDSQVLSIPANTLVVLPVEGSGTVGEAVAGGGEVGRTAISNLLGVWVDHYVLLDLAGLAQIVDARGGITVDLPPGAQVGEEILGPGPTKLTGEQVTAYLNAAPGTERALRWREVLVPLFDGKVDLHGTAPVQTDDEAAADEALNAARGAPVTDLPTEEIEGRLQRASQAELVPLLNRLFGERARLPYDVIILNGTRHETAERNITSQLVPAGYRVVAYGPAKGQHRKTTFVVAGTDAAVPEANTIVKTLGVGKVFLGGEPSGLADVTVVIGKDYLRT